MVLTVRIQTSLSPSLVAHMVKNLPAMWETQVQSLDQEDPLENGMATHSRVLAWKIPWTEEPGRLQSMRPQRVRHDRVTEHDNNRIRTGGKKQKYTVSGTCTIHEVT